VVIRRPPRDPEVVPQPPKLDRKGRLDTAVAGLRVARQTRRQPVPDAVAATTPTPSVPEAVNAPMTKPVPPAPAWLAAERSADDQKVAERPAAWVPPGLRYISTWRFVRYSSNSAARGLRLLLVVSLVLAVWATIYCISKAGQDPNWRLALVPWLFFAMAIRSIRKADRDRR
jgi:hypothetical protein